MNSYSRSSDHLSSTAPKPAGSEGTTQAPSLAAAWGSITQGAGVMWAYAGVGIFQSPLRDLAVFHGFARIIEALQIEWTGLTAARHLFQVPLVDQPHAAQARSGALLAYFPQLSGAGLRVWLKPASHRLSWYRPLEPGTGAVYQASGIVGYPGAPTGIPVPQALVGQPAILALVPEN